MDWGSGHWFKNLQLWQLLRHPCYTSVCLLCHYLALGSPGPNPADLGLETAFIPREVSQEPSLVLPTRPADMLFLCNLAQLKSSLHKLFSCPWLGIYLPSAGFWRQPALKQILHLRGMGLSYKRKFDAQISLHYPSQKLHSGPQGQVQWCDPTLVKHSPGWSYPDAQTHWETQTLQRQRGPCRGAGRCFTTQQTEFLFFPALNAMFEAHSTGSLFYTPKCHHHFAAGPVLQSRESQEKRQKGTASFHSTCPAMNGTFHVNSQFLHGYSSSLLLINWLIQPFKFFFFFLASGLQGY